MDKLFPHYLPNVYQYLHCPKITVNKNYYSYLVKYWVNVGKINLANNGLRMKTNKFCLLFIYPAFTCEHNIVKKRKISLFMKIPGKYW